MVKIGIIGVGKWGKNLLRVFDGLASVQACSVRHRDVSRLAGRSSRVLWTRRYQDILEAPSIDAVVVATPIATHYRIAKQALKAGKHVFVEKPLCRKPEEADELAALSRKRKKILMVGHLFLHHPVYAVLRKLHRRDPIVALHSEWNKLGTFEEGIIDSLVSHEVALSIGLFGANPSRAEVLQSQGIVSKADRIQVELAYPGKRRHSIRIDRLHPFPSRTVQIETKAGRHYHWRDEELWVFDPKKRSFRQVFAGSKEPLLLECRAFLEAIRRREPPSTDAVFGAKVVRVLRALQP